MNCHSCGNSLVGDPSFCPQCGQRVRPVPAYEAHLRDKLRNRYALGELLGRGGMALVYSATDIALQRRVALKVLLPEFSDRDELVARFLQEARLAAQLDNHPNIVRIYGIHQEDDINYFTMSLLEGGTLNQKIKQKKVLGVQEAISIALQAASALSYAHVKGIIHRDVKPENILFDSSGTVVVTDFGIAKAGLGANLTRPGIVLGTPLYMSPEQIQGSELSPASDLYSLGVVLYHMLAGSPPFSGHDGATIMHLHLTETPRAVYTVRASVPWALSDVVDRLLQKEAQNRYPSGPDLIRALKALQSQLQDSDENPTMGSEAPVPQPEEAPPTAEDVAESVPEIAVRVPAEKGRRKLRFWAVLASVLIVSVFLGVLSYLTRDEPEGQAQYSAFQMALNRMAGMDNTQRRVFLEGLLADQPDDASLNMGLASLYYESGDYEKARIRYEEVLRLEPGNTEAGSDLATTLYQLHRVAEAVRQLEAVLDKHPYHAKSLLNLGLILADQGRREEAAKRWRTLLESNPDSPYALPARTQLDALGNPY